MLSPQPTKDGKGDGVNCFSEASKKYAVPFRFFLFAFFRFFNVPRPASPPRR
jgi:hypothetical protein